MVYASHASIFGPLVSTSVTIVPRARPRIDWSWRAGTANWWYPHISNECHCFMNRFKQRWWWRCCSGWRWRVGQGATQGKNLMATKVVWTCFCFKFLFCWGNSWAYKKDTPITIASCLLHSSLYPACSKRERHCMGFFLICMNTTSIKQITDYWLD